MDHEIVLKLSRGEHPPRPCITGRELGDDLWGFITLCWVKPQKRPSARDAVDFLSKYRHKEREESSIVHYDPAHPPPFPLRTIQKLISVATSIGYRMKTFLESSKPSSDHRIPIGDNQAYEQVRLSIDDELGGSPGLAAGLKIMLQSDQPIGGLAEEESSQAIDALYRVCLSFPAAGIALSKITCRSWIPSPRTKRKIRLRG